MRDRGPDEAEAVFERLVARFATDPSVTLPSAGKGGKFGASALKVDGKIFAMLSKGELVVKLPRRRVDELVASGAGKAFESGQGCVMREWVTIAPHDDRHCGELAEEARRFVAAGAEESRRA